jgi:hypothetical protein
MSQDDHRPRPGGPPQPLEGRTELAGKAAGTAASVGEAVLTAGAVLGALGLVAAISVPSLGSTRSQRLQWKERQREVKEAIANQDEPR